MHPVTRSSARLGLRELAIADVEALLAIYGSAVATEHLSFEPRNREQVEQVVARSVTAATAIPRTEYALAIVETETAELIGSGRLALDPHQERGATLGFALHPDVWGRGFGVEAVRLLLEFGFNDLRLHRIWGARSPLNKASAKTMSAVGMVEEGTIREHVLKAGTWRDSVVHAITDREFSSRS
ncbi:GNAT family N-acetyltransferase [Streptomyces bobili]|jgi:[ribosomal protein S5]-alanine N-acetyltransferase|uniref:GNAT family N-acetyltransferase n=1 Tax=Streptomyces bobili TaxID=67280 RepID=A0ABZ1QQK4_9ACTN|nr:GNAT family protein [Streptomyces bobili]